ncbi:MAG: hypothetical protein ACKVQC_10755 [Elusimicrobiota bacterium]
MNTDLLFFNLTLKDEIKKLKKLILLSMREESLINKEQFTELPELLIQKNILTQRIKINELKKYFFWKKHKTLFTNPQNINEKIQIAECNALLAKQKKLAIKLEEINRENLGNLTKTKEVLF